MDTEDEHTNTTKATMNKIYYRLQIDCDGETYFGTTVHETCDEDSTAANLMNQLLIPKRAGDGPGFLVLQTREGCAIFGPELIQRCVIRMVRCQKESSTE